MDDFTITYGIDERTESSLSFSQEAYTITKGDDFTEPTLTVTPGELTGITYESSDINIATVDTEGKITFGEATGTVTIKATFAGNDTYKPSSASYTITVNAGTLGQSDKCCSNRSCRK